MTTPSQSSYSVLFLLTRKGELVTAKGGNATNIKVADNGIVTVESGEWNGKKVNVTSTAANSFTIGYTSGDKTANAAFNGTSLEVCEC